MKLIQGENIEVVEEMKVVGFMLRSDMKTISNTEYTFKDVDAAKIKSIRSIKVPTP